MSPGEVKDVQVPDSVPVDLRAKLIVCLIHLHVNAPLEVNGTEVSDNVVTVMSVNVSSPSVPAGAGVGADGTESGGDRRPVPGCRRSLPGAGRVHGRSAAAVGARHI